MGREASSTSASRPPTFLDYVHRRSRNGRPTVGTPPFIGGRGRGAGPGGRRVSIPTLTTSTTLTTFTSLRATPPRRGAFPGHMSHPPARIALMYPAILSWFLPLARGPLVPLVPLVPVPLVPLVPVLGVPGVHGVLGLLGVLGVVGVLRVLGVLGVLGVRLALE